MNIVLRFCKSKIRVRAEEENAKTRVSSVGSRTIRDINNSTSKSDSFKKKVLLFTLKANRRWTLKIMILAVTRLVMTYISNLI